VGQFNLKTAPWKRPNYFFFAAFLAFLAAFFAFFAIVPPEGIGLLPEWQPSAVFQTFTTGGLSPPPSYQM
jgi:hypothetical protein